LFCLFVGQWNYFEVVGDLTMKFWWAFLQEMTDYIMGTTELAVEKKTLN